MAALLILPFNRLLVQRILRVAAHGCECRFNPWDCKKDCHCTACKVYWEVIRLRPDVRPP